MSDINFSKLTWENLPARTTALSATNLNRIENGIADSVDGVNANAHDIAELRTQVGALANGSPTPVATVAEMTDESAVYLYTGSETGYTAGNWYYYDGSTWTSGGTYGGAVTDTTLTQAGMAADAKVTGDEISELKEDLNHKVTYLEKAEQTVSVETALTFPTTDKGIEAHGNIISLSGYAISDYIDLTNVTGIYRTGSTKKFTMYRYNFYDENKNFLSTAGDNTDYEFVEHDGKQVAWLTLNPNAKYAIVSFDTSRPLVYYVVSDAVEVASYTLPPIIINGENILTDALDGKQAKVISDDIAERKSLNIFNPSLLEVKGYYYDFTDGVTKVNYANCQITEKIPVNGAVDIYVRQNYSNSSNSAFIVQFYNGDTYLGYASMYYAHMGDDSFKFSKNQPATHIRFYTNSLDVAGDNICISLTELDAFSDYQIRYYVKESALPDKNYYPLYGKKIANFGDSVFGNKRPPNDVSTALANITGATVYNLGFGGCRMSQHSANWDAFCMYRLADAVATGDFSLQNAVDVDNVSGMPSYFKETRTLLESIDFSEVDIITIAYGTNDFTASVSLDNANDPKDTTTFCGALRYSLEKLLTAYPQLHIFVCTPTWRFWMDNGTFLYDSDTHEINGKLLTDFVEAVKTVSNAYHVKAIDNYYDLGINQYNRSHWFPSNDGTHHNKDGGVLIARHMITEMF